MAPSPTNLSNSAMFDRLFPDEDFGFRMKFHKGSIPEFFDDTPNHLFLTKERQKWLSAEPEKYCIIEPAGSPLLLEVIKTAFPKHLTPSEQQAAPRELCRLLAERVEPDFLLMVPNKLSGELKLEGGSVCFPSSWSLQEKIGHNLEAIHGPVPGLSQAIGSQINLFLEKIRPGISWERSNWGLSRSPELNQHPTRFLPRLDGTTPLEEIFLRVEWQSLVSLPFGGVLFGIRIFVFPLQLIISHEPVKRRFARALGTMPEDVAIYKNVHKVRRTLLKVLSET